MKTNWFKNAFAVLAGFTLLTACSSDDNGENYTAPVFPEMKAETIAAGEAKELTFKANTVWKLVSDKTWCQFDDNGVTTSQLSGQPGDITVKVTVKEQGQDFTDAKAKLDLTMGSQTQTLFEITRPAMERSVKMYKKPWGENPVLEEIGEVQLTYHKTENWDLRVGFTANFDWKVLSASEGLSLEFIAGKAGQTTEDSDFKTTTVSINYDKIPYALAADAAIVISDLDGKNTFSFPVKYAGMDEEELHFEYATPNFISNPSSGHTVTMDASGKLYMSTMVGTELTEETSATFSVQAKEMEYSTVIVELVDMMRMGQLTARPVDPESSWVKITDDGKGNIALEAKEENTGAERTLYCLILPKKLAESSAYNGYFQNGQLNAERLYGVGIKQEGAAVSESKSFKLMWGGSITRVEPVPFAKSADLNGRDLSEFANASTNNTYVYAFTTAEARGALMVLPVGFADGYVNTALSTQPFEVKVESGTWIEADKIQEGNYYDTGFNPLQAFSFDTFDTTPKGLAWFNFYEDAADVGQKPADATLILIKKD